MTPRPLRRALAAAILIAAGSIPAGRSAFAQGYVADYQPVIILHDFGAGELGHPMAGLVMDKAGNLYGTESGGNGAVFELSPPPPGAPYKGWKETTLYTFQGGSDGFGTQSQLYLDAAGNLYGTTQQGGNTGCYNDEGCGTIFELSPPAAGQTGWTKSILYTFTGGEDGAYPGLSNPFQFVSDSSGNLYGSTSDGSGAPCSNAGCGRAFELSPPGPSQVNWTYKVIYNGGTGGSWAIDAQGNLYGAAAFNAFKLSPPPEGQTGWTETQIASFGSYYSITGMIFDSQGNLYGTNFEQPSGKGVGDVYELSPPAKGTRWAFNILARFNGSDGSKPTGAPNLDTAGNLLGVTGIGGNGKGVVYRVAPDGILTVFHKFEGGRDGSTPYGSLVVDGSGNIFGISSNGGTNGNGAVWEISAPAK